jgi:D-alanyl-D-alanine carboxypeptidase
LVAIGSNPDGDKVRLAPSAARAWKKMKAAAAKDGRTLLGLSGFRSVARQTEVFLKKKASGERLDTILTWLAAPGYSEHHTGRAIDVGSPDEPPLAQSFAKTEEYRWLLRRGAEFGFRLSFPKGNRHRIGYEPWHWFHKDTYY